MLFTKFREIKLMNHIIQANSNNIFSQSILALTVFKKGLPNIMGQKLSCGEPRTRKSAGYLVFPQKTSTSLTIPTGEIVSLLASLIVTYISSISAGAISCIISLYKEIGIALALA